MQKQACLLPQSGPNALVTLATARGSSLHGKVSRDGPGTVTLNGAQMQSGYSMRVEARPHTPLAAIMVNHAGTHGVCWLPGSVCV